MTQPRILLTPRRAGLVAGHDNLLEVLIRVQAPPRPSTLSSTPKNLALVLDRSGSMDGEPLVEALRCARFIVDGLAPTDRASLVVYDHEVEVRVPARSRGDGASLRRALEGVEARGTTNLHGGWLAGAGEVSAGVGAGVTRVLLISDGQANEGLTEQDAITEQCRQLAEAGVSTTTIGLGRRFNEDLMAAMASQGGGNAYYGQRAEDLFDAFREELELLDALCGRQLRLAVTVPEGCTVTCVNGYPLRDDGTLALPDLAYDGEAWALLQIRAPGGRLETASVRVGVDYTGLDDTPRSLPPVELVLPSLPAAAFAALAEEPMVVQRVQELEAARLQEAARLAARSGDWARVDALLRTARAGAAGNPWVEASITVLERYAAAREREAFSKEARYKSRRMRTRLSAAPGVGEGTTYLRRKVEQGRGE